jgi:cytochrome c oxidase cbb3-type subunit 3
MKNLVIVSIVVSLVLMGIIYGYVGDIIGDDMVNILSMLAALAILILTVGVSLKYINQMKNDKASGELADENWDGIGEYKNELPIGWAVSFLGTIVWAFWYWTAGYPVNAYSQIGEYNEEVSEYQSKFESEWSGANTEVLTKMGKSLFLVQCAPCHGETADGMSGKAADLTARISEENVLYVIKNGSNNLKTNYPGGMPAGLVSGKDAQEIANYVANGMHGTAPVMFSVCAGCHGQDGKGIANVAPNIATFDTKLISAVLKNGKDGAIGHMPSFRGRFSDIQEKAVGTYILSLGQ